MIEIIWIPKGHHSLSFTAEGIIILRHIVGYICTPFWVSQGKWQTSIPKWHTVAQGCTQQHLSIKLLQFKWSHFAGYRPLSTKFKTCNMLTSRKYARLIMNLWRFLVKSKCKITKAPFLHNPFFSLLTRIRGSWERGKDSRAKRTRSARANRIRNETWRAKTSSARACVFWPILSVITKRNYFQPIGRRSIPFLSEQIFCRFSIKYYLVLRFLYNTAIIKQRGDVRFLLS